MTNNKLCEGCIEATLECSIQIMDYATDCPCRSCLVKPRCLISCDKYDVILENCYEEKLGNKIT